MLRPTLAIKFVVLISLILVLTFSCIGFFLFRHQKEILYSDLETLAVSLSRNLSSNSVYGLLTRNIQNLSGLLNSLSNYEDVAFAWIESDSGRVLATYRQIPKDLKGGRRDLLKQQFHPVRDLTDQPSIISIRHSPGIWLIREPVLAPQIISPDELVLGGHMENPPTVKIGEIYVGISLERVNAALHSMQTRSLDLLFGIAILSMVLTLVLVHWISLPLKKLRQATECVTAGILPPRVEIRSRDEIGELAEAFNNMIEQVSQSKKAIERAYNELEKVNQSLEETVEKRTAELRKSIFQLTSARDELEAAYSEMKQMYHAKAAFLRSASHELRTPLTAIKANVDFLCTFNADSLGHEGMEIMEAVNRNVNNMHFMVEEMLKMVRLDIGAVPLEADEIQLKGLVMSCINELYSLQAGISVEVSVPDSLVLTADKAKLHDVFTNILSNAYRFTPEGGKVQVSAQSKDGGRVMIEIRDSGVGISKKHLSHIFEPFYQAHHGREGTGLGLSIVKSIIDRHKGTIEVESSPGQGTVFTIHMQQNPDLSRHLDS